jgi:hypothetical protein
MLLRQATWLANQIDTWQARNAFDKWTVIAIVRISDATARCDYQITAVSPQGVEHTIRSRAEWERARLRPAGFNWDDDDDLKYPEDSGSQIME